MILASRQFWQFSLYTGPVLISIRSAPCFEGRLTYSLGQTGIHCLDSVVCVPPVAPRVADTVGLALWCFPGAASKVACCRMSRGERSLDLVNLKSFSGRKHCSLREQVLKINVIAIHSHVSSACESKDVTLLSVSFMPGWNPLYSHFPIIIQIQGPQPAHTCINVLATREIMIETNTVDRSVVLEDPPTLLTLRALDLMVGDIMIMIKDNVGGHDALPVGKPSNPCHPRWARNRPWQREGVFFEQVLAKSAKSIIFFQIGKHIVLLLKKTQTKIVYSTYSIQ